ncbi:MAG: hypothetical protein ABIC95_05930 [archaeon]
MGLGIAFGLPIGIPIGSVMGNIALGPTIGMAIGASMEKKHEKELRPLTEKEERLRTMTLLVGLGMLLAGVIAFFFARNL